MTVVGNDNDNNAQESQNPNGTVSVQSGKNNNGNNSHGENLPQTGEAGASALIGLGVILIVGSTIAFYIKQR